MSEAVTRLNAALEGRYRIEGELGEGGMATVYLAVDLKHERKVALKVLKPELAAVMGADRFLAEIKTTAHLQHPHILPLHDSGEAGGLLYYVMPYIEGESLKERLAREQQLPVDEAVRIATDVAEALHSAHQQGVIHRDIKPANILLSQGRPLVADFGIALAVSAAGGGRLTETGLSMGTPHYMSPEQAMGDQQVAPTSDVYALGCVLYEMLMGEPPFTGGTAQAVLGKIVTSSPESVTQHRRSVPTNVEAVIHRALEKVPADRFTGAQEFASALADPGFRHGKLAGAGETTGAGPWNRLATAVTALSAVLALALAWSVSRPEPPLPVARFDVTPSDESAFVGGFAGIVAALSPDGQRMVYVGVGRPSQLWQRGLNDLEPTPIPGTDGADNPVLSSDGTSVAFWQTTSLKTVSLLGGPAFTVIPQGGLGSVYIDWGDDGMLYFVDSESDGLFRVPAAGGTPEVVAATPEGVTRVGIPDALPDGRGVLVTVRRDAPSEATIAVVGPNSGEIRELLAGVSARYAESGHIVYATAENSLMAAPFDLNRLEVTGPSVALLQDVHVRFPGLGAHFALSESGTLVYRTTGRLGGVEVEAVWADRTGMVTQIDPDWTFGYNGNNSSLALSPDGDRLAVSVPTGTGGSDIWVKQLDRGPFSRFTFEGVINRRPSWSPDGQFVTYISDGNVLRARADGTGTTTSVLAGPPGVLEAFFSSDGEWLVYRTGGIPGGNPNILALQTGVDSVGRELLSGDYVEWMPTLSSDGRWLAYVSEETGRREVYVRPFPDVDSGKQQVSTTGGRAPQWSHSGRELFYLNDEGDLIAVQVIAEPTFAAGRQQVLFSAVDFQFNVQSYDVTKDDQRFVMMRRSGDTEEAQGRLVLVQNFFEELRQRVSN